MKKYVTIILYCIGIRLTHLCVFSAFFRKQITSKEEKSHNYELNEIFWQVGQEIFTLVERVVVRKQCRVESRQYSKNQKNSPRFFDIFSLLLRPAASLGAAGPLFRNKKLMLDEMTQRNASKYKNPRIVLLFSSRATLFFP